MIIGKSKHSLDLNPKHWCTAPRKIFLSSKANFLEAAKVLVTFERTFPVETSVYSSRLREHKAQGAGYTHCFPTTPRQCESIRGRRLLGGNR